MFAMTLIGWIIALTMITGIYLVKSFESAIKRETTTDEDRLRMESFIMMFYDGGLSHKVRFVLTYGVRLWLLIFFKEKDTNE